MSLRPLWLSALILTACSTGKVDASDSGGGDSGSSAAATGWCGVQATIADSCVVCHDATGAQGDLDLETDPFGRLVDGSSAYPGETLVVPGEPDASFLLVKLEGLQPEEEGDLMPPGSPLSTSELDLFRAWIEDGASEDDCTGSTGDGGATGDSFHGDGYAEPGVHGLDAKLATLVCTDCHGDDLAGGTAEVSCDGCHEDGWRTDCTFCHGGLDNSTGAPPEDIDDGTTDAAYGAHSAHVEEQNHAAFACTQCHQQPTDVLSSGHLWDGTGGVAEVDLGSGLSPDGSWDAETSSCSNLYCHGDGQGALGQPSVDDAPLSCHSCHGDASSSSPVPSSLSGRHSQHLGEGLDCGNCHSLTASGSTTISGPEYHVDGTVDFAPDETTMYSDGSTCTGLCHWGFHWYEEW